MRHLTLGEVVELHQRLLIQSAGAPGVRDLGLLESALAQPHATFDGHDLHPTVVDKASALGFALVANHPFIDGNKRVGHAAMEVFLVLNGYEIDATVEEQERLMLDVAPGLLDRAELAHWLNHHLRAMP
jgi:death-on-curing protein